MARVKKSSAPPTDAVSYRHTDADLPSRPEIGAQSHFKKHQPPTEYRFDSSLSPELQWDGQNPAREPGEALLNTILEASTLEQAKAAARRLQAMSEPFLNWSGKAEHLSFEVPTLPLFVHERLSTQAILQTLQEHKRDQQTSLFDQFFGADEHNLADQVLRAYEHRDKWVNRLMLGDSLVVMNSLLRYEALGGQVQMIYMDPPYGVKFGSNFQPFVRRRDVTHNADEDLTREPEMVQAYRDTWELGLHSYLTYLRDRLLLSRELLAPSGSIFVQISDENLHHVREVMDEVFGAENFVSCITFKKTSSASGRLLSSVADYILWYAQDLSLLKYRQPYLSKTPGEAGASQYTWAMKPDGTVENYGGFDTLRSQAPNGSRVFAHDNITSQRPAREGDVREFQFKGKSYTPGKGTFKTDFNGLKRLAEANRLLAVGDTLRYIRYLDDFPCYPISNVWDDTITSGFSSAKLYVVQTNSMVVERCIQMTTDPGDLVLDPTCGSGTTAFVAEKWGRRWITVDTSRVPLALARQRLLSASFDYFELQEENRGPAGGFVYKRQQNSRGEEVGGIVPHIKLENIANNEPPAEEVLVHKPEKKSGVVRVTGPFTMEATIPAAEGLDEEPDTPGIQGADHQKYVQRMLDTLRRSPVLRLAGNRMVTLKQIRTPAKTLALSAEAVVDVSSYEFQVSGGKGGVRVSGLGGLAEGDGVGGGSLQHDTDISAGRNLRPGKPNEASSGERTQQHRGGTGAIDEGGVLPVPGPGTGLPAGAGNPDRVIRNVGFHTTGEEQRTASQVAGDPAHALQSDLETRNPKLETPVAILFGPENGALSLRLIEEAWQEASVKRYQSLFVIGFGIDPKAREFVEKAGKIGIPCFYLQATMDLQMGDLLKHMRSSQVFSICGLPDVEVSSFKFQVSSGGAETRNPKLETRNPKPETPTLFQVSLLGLDTFDPVSMNPIHYKPGDIPAWLLDTDYNGMVFRVRQAFFPKTGAWDNLKRSLKSEFDESVWGHLSGTTSAPFTAGDHQQIAVKVIDERGNELIVVKALE